MSLYKKIFAPLMALFLQSALAVPLSPLKNLLLSLSTNESSSLVPVLSLPIPILTQPSTQSLRPSNMTNIKPSNISAVLHATSRTGYNWELLITEGLFTILADAPEATLRSIESKIKPVNGPGQPVT